MSRIDVEALEAYISQQVMVDPLVNTVFKLMASEQMTKEHGILLLAVEALKSRELYKRDLIRAMERQVAPPMIVPRKLWPLSRWARFWLWIRGL